MEFWKLLIESGRRKRFEENWIESALSARILKCASNLDVTISLHLKFFLKLERSYKVFSFLEKLVQKSMFWSRRKSIWSSICRLFLHSSRPFDRCKIKLRRIVRSNMKLSEVKTSPILVLGLLRSKIWSEKIFLDYTSIERVKLNHGSLYPRIHLFYQSIYRGFNIMW